MSGRVYLVGAGCGSADLITLRGMRLLQKCDVVVYDDLIDPELLSAAPARADRVYVGKRRGRHSASQEEISQLLVEKAREGKQVVRLKGGDPFVFGRGGEECLVLQKEEIPFEVVPGVSSAIQDKLRPALEREGAQVFSACSLLVDELPFRFDLSQLCRKESAWVVLTSQNGVCIFFRRLAEQGIDLRCLHRCRFAVIGPVTAAALREHGIQADLCPPVHTSEDLAQALLKAGTPGNTVYLFRSAQGSRILNDLLAENYTLQDVPLYNLIPERTQEPLPPDVQYLAFSSAGGVEHFLKLHGSVPASAVCVCIGEVTARALARRYEKSFLTSPEISTEGIVAAILKHREDSNTKERWG